MPKSRAARVRIRARHERLRAARYLARAARAAAAAAAAARVARARAREHNDTAWILPDEITAEIFSRVGDTRWMVRVASLCTQFKRVSEFPICYRHISVTGRAPLVTDDIVSGFIERADYVRSLHVEVIGGPPSPMLVGTFLYPLMDKRGQFETLRLVNLKRLLCFVVQPLLSELRTIEHIICLDCSIPSWNLYSIAGAGCFPLMKSLVTRDLNNGNSVLLEQLALELCIGSPLIKKFIATNLYVSTRAKEALIRELQLESLEINHLVVVQNGVRRC